MEKADENSEAKPVTLNSYAAMANFGVNYLINENYKLGLGLDSDYSFGLNNKLFDTYEKGTDKLMNNFEGEKAKSFAEYVKENSKKIKDETAKMVISEDVLRTHLFNLTPKVNAELKYGKVTVKPEVSAKFELGKDYNVKDDTSTAFGLKKISGKGTLNIEYRW